MKTTARNELNGTIIDIKSGGVMSEIIVKISEELTISATITNDAKEALNLQVGGNISVIVKSSHVILSKAELRVTARNNIQTKVKKIIKGAVNSEVKLGFGDHELCAIITNDAVEDLNIQTGDAVYAIFKASSVILVG